MSSTVLSSLTFCSGVSKLVSLAVIFLPNVMRQRISLVCAKLHSFVDCGTTKMNQILIKYDPHNLLLGFQDIEYNNLAGGKVRKSYVYWTVHHCDSWRIRDQLDVTVY